MVPTFDLSGVLAHRGCQKPDCLNQPGYRHHKGDERKWVTAFEWTPKGKTKTYQDFVARYKLYSPQDCVRVCGDHHEEIHEIFERETLAYMRQHKLHRPRWAWSWKEANGLMDHLRKVCEEWIATPTPGLKRRKLTSYK